MINLDSIINKNNKEHNEKWPNVSDRWYRNVIISGSGSWKTKTLLNLISQQDDIDKMYFIAIDLSELKYDFLMKKC